MERFSASVHVDGALFREDVRGSIAHARMLARQGILTSEEAEQLVQGARAGRAGDRDRRARARPRARGRTHERRAAAVRAGRRARGQAPHRAQPQRPDRDRLPALAARAARSSCAARSRSCAAALVERAAREVDVVLPGYTHLQRAQPVRLAHHWLAHYEALARDDGRLADARARMSRSPLGAGALAGSTLPIERESTAAELGFAGPARNSLDAVVGARRGARAPVRARDPDGAPVADLRGARAVELVGVRLRRARRRVRHRLEPDAAEEEPRRRRARARQDRPRGRRSGEPARRR